MTIKEYKAAHYQANKEKYKASARSNYAQNKERAKASATAWKNKNRQKVRDSNKKWAKNNPKQFAEIKLREQLRRVYWTLEQFNAAFESQKGLCAICGKESEKRLSADHNHETNTPRELLCNHCNLILGKMNDDPKLLEKAASYLRKWGKT
jgi:hypothetical protein